MLAIIINNEIVAYFSNEFYARDWLDDRKDYRIDEVEYPVTFLKKWRFIIFRFPSTHPNAIFFDRDEADKWIREHDAYGEYRWE